MKNSAIFPEGIIEDTSIKMQRVLNDDSINSTAKYFPYMHSHFFFFFFTNKFISVAQLCPVFVTP